MKIFTLKKIFLLFFIFGIAPEAFYSNSGRGAISIYSFAAGEIYGSSLEARWQISMLEIQDGNGEGGSVS